MSLHIWYIKMDTNLRIKKFEKLKSLFNLRLFLAINKAFDFQHAPECGLHSFQFNNQTSLMKRKERIKTYKN
jgi:hypothetical protein